MPDFRNAVLLQNLTRLSAANGLELGDGSGSFDTNLYRGSAAELRTGAYINADRDIGARTGVSAQTKIGALGPSLQAGLLLGSAGDTNLYRSAAATLKTDGTLAAATGLCAGAVGAIDATSKLNSDSSGHYVGQAGGTQRVWHNPVVYRNASASVTGTLKITLPVAWSSDMIRCVIRGYDYTVSTGHWEVEVGGYNYSGGYWANYSGSTRGRPPFSTVRLGWDGTKVCILLGTTSTVWAYPSFAITELQTQGTGWGTGAAWAVSFLTSETGLTTWTPALTVADSNVLSPITTVSTNYTVAATDRVVLMTTNNLTMTLPTSPPTGTVITLRTKLSNTYTFVVSASVNIDGQSGSSVTFSAKTTLFYDGANWWSIA